MIDLVRRGQSSVYGQVSDLTIKGLTATNLIKNGNFANGRTRWYETNYSSLSVNLNTLIVTGGASSTPRASQTLDNVKINTSMFVKLKVRVTNGACAGITAWMRDGSSGTAFGYGPRPVSQDTPIANQWYTLSGIININSELSDNLRLIIEHSYVDAATANGKIMEVQEVMAIDITAHGLDSLTVDQCNQRFPYWFDGAKSTLPVRVKSVGKNLLNLTELDWEEGTFDGSSAKNGEEATYGSNRIRTKEFIPVFPNAQYSISLVNSAYEIWVLEFDTNKTTRTDGTGYIYYQANTFITKNNTRYIRLCIRKKDVSYTDNTPASAVYASDINNIKPQLEVGPVATVYEPGGKESIITTPEIGKSLPNGTKDEVNVTSGLKTQRIGVKTNVASGTVINYADMATGGQFVAYYANGTQQVGVKGDTLTALAVSLNYQLAEPIITQLEPQPLTIFPNGTRWVEFGTKEIATYNNGIAITNVNIPIKQMVKVDKLGIEDGHWKRTAIDLSKLTVAGNGLSFTIAGAVNGETYEYSYDYDSSLSTLPDLVIPSEPSLVTRNNRTIVLYGLP